VNEAAQKHFTTIAAIVGEVLGAIEADLSTMTAPDTAVLNKYPEFGETVTTVLTRAEGSLELLQVEAEGTTEWARRLGYI
jgi:CO/xanthine dehydrogenase Mo-binding subunit